MKSSLLYFSKNRHATWLELFFDLVFVALIGKVAHMLGHTHHGHLDADLIKYPLLVVPIWWLWASHTLYNNIYDRDSRGQRILTLLIMFLMIVISMFLKIDFTEVYIGYLIIFALIRYIIGVFYLFMVPDYEEGCAYSKKRGKLHMVTATIGLVAILFPEPYVYFIAYTSMFLELIGAIKLERSEHHIKPHIEHLIERTGLLTIILLGEAIISIIGSIGDITWTLPKIISSLSGFIIIGSFWWIEFDSFHRLEHNKKLDKPYKVMLPHLILTMGLMITANIVKFAILEDLEIHTFKILLLIGTILFYIGKQIPYAFAFKDVRKYQVINSLTTFAIVGVGFIFHEYYQIMLVSTFALGVYIFLNYKFVLLNEHLTFE